MLVLASASPRRADLLRKLLLEFTVRPAGLEEVPPPGLAPADAALHLARAKAEVVAADVQEGWVLGADTLVHREGEAFGKPSTAQEALAMLGKLQGAVHDVFTGICVVRQPGMRALVHVEHSQVRLARLERPVLEAYVATGEPLGKAGGYAIQGIAAAYVEEVRGGVDNVVGLPVRPTVLLLERAGYPLPPHLALGLAKVPGKQP